MIGVMTAMPEELEPILKRAEVEEVVEVGKNRYHLGKLGGKPVVMAYSKIGKVFSAITATTMILKFGISKLLFSGVAGAISPDLKIGDLVLATATCQHDLDLTPFGHPHGYVPEGAVCFYTDETLNRLARRVARRVGVELKEGIIATGDQFIADPKRKEWIGEQFGAIALEMEGGAVGKVCWSFEIPYLILRAISDGAGEGAEVDFDTFLEESSERSAKLLAAILEEMEE
jgi:adenosylhomocysteine/aminodeoxyfutalosine nucleosidase